MRMLDLFCGRFGWSKAFAARGWTCVGIDLIRPPEIPQRCRFVQGNVLELDVTTNEFILGDWQENLGSFDFVCASSPCEQFSVHGMGMFHPNPPCPELGIKLFNHTREVCEASGVPYVMENVRPAQKFVGNAVMCCGPFALWGTGVPPILPQGISKGFGKFDREFILKIGSSKSKKRQEHRAKVATIPPELASCVAEYAERLLETEMAR